MISLLFKKRQIKFICLFLIPFILLFINNSYSQINNIADTVSASSLWINFRNMSLKKAQLKAEKEAIARAEAAVDTRTSMSTTTAQDGKTQRVKSLIQTFTSGKWVNSLEKTTYEYNDIDNDGAADEIKATVYGIVKIITNEVSADARIVVETNNYTDQSILANESYYHLYFKSAENGYLAIFEVNEFEDNKAVKILIPYLDDFKENEGGSKIEGNNEYVFYSEKDGWKGLKTKNNSNEIEVHTYYFIFSNKEIALPFLKIQADDFMTIERKKWEDKLTYYKTYQDTYKIIQKNIDWSID